MVPTGGPKLYIYVYIDGIYEGSESTKSGFILEQFPLSSLFLMVDKLLHIGVKFCSNFSLKQTNKGVK
jgi:hypothetical protein